MMSGIISARDRRTLVRGGIALATIIAIGRGIPALRALEEDTSRDAEALVEQLAQVHAAKKGGRAIADSLRVRRDRFLRARAAMLQADSPQLAAGALAAILGDHAKQSHARINATVLRPDPAFRKGLARVLVRVSFSTDVQGLSEMLESVENDSHMLAVRELNVSGSDPGGSTTRAENLGVELLVEAQAFEAARPKDHNSSVAR